ncbi:PTS system cellobiose-specific IIB component [Thermohydrogenium kirishiense]|uniref:PTS sugar transporter subunit IIB n=1 Tax=Thermoanaerobacterium thermosaccharolyticum TaxID=1517 RepID=A0A231VC30_THETR|nr:PTS sugar transporter subunit IIB [Thermoanaerobacterium thermosaccharolyticum]OXT05737.1 PTS sugar transporter subunit IIB [Thermoanaerobacterium thermosaccharolyticum]TCW35678.1 PTS system cellobiose-specific IIB component [Thermohydrogenium kirishiense]
MNILLVCSAGMSTSLLVNNMKKFAEPGTKINAVAFSELESVIDDYDVILVGPQLRFKLNNVKKLAESKNKPVDVIEPVAYGRMDGKKVYEFAKKIYNDNNGGK